MFNYSEEDYDGKGGLRLPFTVLYVYGFIKLY